MVILFRRQNLQTTQCLNVLVLMATLLKEGYTIWETEPADYAVFQCFGSDGGCLAETWSKFFKEFVPQTGYMQTDNTDYEIYFENGESGLFCELWVPVKHI